MSLRGLISRFMYARSREERAEEAGKIISKRLKELLERADGELNRADHPTGLGNSTNEDVSH